jgi:hypothetical protein
VSEELAKAFQIKFLVFVDGERDLDLEHVLENAVSSVAEETDVLEKRLDARIKKMQKRLRYLEKQEKITLEVFKEQDERLRALEQSE